MFTRQRIVKNAVHGMKNNKSHGIDNINAELVKNAPEFIFNMLAEIINTFIEQKVLPTEAQIAILITIPKAKKPEGELTSLRLIMLLTLIRKLIAIVTLNRMYYRLTAHTPSHNLRIKPEEARPNTYLQ